MSRPLDVTVGDLRIRCFAAACKGLKPEELDALGIRPGDVLLSFEDYAYITVREAHRRDVAAAIAPPGALIGNPPEIAPLLEPGAGGGC